MSTPTCQHPRALADVYRDGSGWCPDCGEDLPQTTGSPASGAPAPTLAGPSGGAGLPVLPYAGTSGHSGSDTSRERAEREDGSGTTASRQAAVLRLVDGAGVRGVTVHEASRVLGTHHGQTSAALSNLESAGLVLRVAERRDRCHVYVVPWNAGDRVPYRPPSRPSRAALEARLAAVGRLAEARCETYWPGTPDATTCATSGDKTPDAYYEADRYCWPCRIRDALGSVE